MLTHVELTTAIAGYIVNFYKPLRRHSSLGYFARDEFEALASTDTEARTLIAVGQ